MAQKIPKTNITTGYYSPNNQIKEGWTGGEGTNAPPHYTGPNSSFTRAYYSPNTDAYELGWRGGYGPTGGGHIDYFKNAIALAALLVTNGNTFNKQKTALPLSVSLTSASKRNIRFKFAVAMQTSAIVSK